VHITRFIDEVLIFTVIILFSRTTKPHRWCYDQRAPHECGKSWVRAPTE